MKSHVINSLNFTSALKILRSTVVSFFLTSHVKTLIVLRINRTLLSFNAYRLKRFNRLKQSFYLNFTLIFNHLHLFLQCLLHIN